MLEKLPPKKKAKPVKVVQTAKKKSTSSRKKTPKKSAKKRSISKKPQGTSQMKLISIYIILGILFLGYIFYHTALK